MSRMFNLKELLEGKQSVALGGHVRPDGDCVGSTMGLYLYLKENFPQIETDLYLESVPEAYSMIRHTDEVKSELPEGKIYDLFICMDCGDLQRLGFSQKLFIESKQTACIDHHVSNEAFADVNYIVPDASSTSELVYNLLDYDKMSLETAEALYMGIAHDTGIFRYSCTSPETMEAAAQLMRKGVDTAKITDRTYYEKTYVQNQILGRALLESVLFYDGKCIFTTVTMDEMEFYGVTGRELGGIVEQLRLTDGVEVAIFLYQTGEEEYKVSLRSKKKIDVAAIATQFGGGGHVRAAGYAAKGSVYQIINSIGELIEKQYNAM